MPCPEVTEFLEKFGSDGDEAFVSSFGMFLGDADGEIFTIDMGGADVKCFVEPESTLVDGGEEGAVTTIAKGF